MVSRRIGFAVMALLAGSTLTGCQGNAEPGEVYSDILWISNDDVYYVRFNPEVGAGLWVRDASSGEDRIVWEDRRPLGRCEEGNIGNLFPADSGLIGVAVECWDGGDGALYTFDPRNAETTLVPHTDGWSGMVKTPLMDFGIADGRGGMAAGRWSPSMSTSCGQ